MAEEKRTSFRRTSLLLVILLVFNSRLLTGCSFFEKEEEPLSISGFAFNTTYTVTLYQGGNQMLLDSLVSECSHFEEIFSRTMEGSELYRINALQQIFGDLKAQNQQAAPEWYGKEIVTHWQEKGEIPQYSINEEGKISVQLSDELANLMKKGLYYSELSEGHFDITIGSVSSLWDFTADNPKVPSEKDIEAGLGRVDYRELQLTENELLFGMPGMKLDLGGIAKGFIADQLKNYLIEQGVSSGLVNLGGNILCIGEKPEGEGFQIGIQQPFAERDETIGIVDIKDSSVVSSGIYERYFEAENGEIYHHILDPATGYPYQNHLLGITILSETSVDGDGLSTTAFSLGLEEGMALIESIEGVEALFITEDEKHHYSSGFEEKLLQQKS